MDRMGGKLSSSKSQTRARVVEAISTRYFGQTPSGHIKLVRGDVVMFGIGKLYPVISKREVAGRKKVKLNRTPVRVSPSYSCEAGITERRIACLGRNSGKEFRFIGIIESTGVRNDAMKPVAGQKVISSTANENIKCKEGRALIDELELIAAARGAGFNPTLRLNQVCALLQESRSNIYRKIACGAFPPPVKRGRGSFWPLSQVEKYAAGDWPSPAKI